MLSKKLMIATMSLMMITMSSAYTYHQYPVTDSDNDMQQTVTVPTSLAAILEGATHVEEVVEQQQETVEQYLDGLLQTIDNSQVPDSIKDQAEGQVEQVQESYQEAGDLVQDVVEILVDTLYPTQSNQTTDDDNTQNDVTDDDVDTQSYVTDDDTQSYVTDDDVIDNAATTPAVYAATTEADDSQDVDDDVSTTTAPAVTTESDSQSQDVDDTTTTVYQFQTEDDGIIGDDDDDSYDDDAATTLAPVPVTQGETYDVSTDDDDDVTTTTASVDRTLSTIDDEELSDEQDLAMTTQIYPDESDNDDDDDVTTQTYPAVPNLCEGCRMKHGVGYNPHPSDCTLFVQCRLDKEGWPEVAGVKPCPHGLYWNQQILACDYAINVQCVDDVCQGYRSTKRSAATCRGYWDCGSGNALAKCCDDGHAYNPATASCEVDPHCHQRCNDSAAIDYECSNLRGVAGKPGKFEMLTAANTWVEMSCPASLVFSTNPCGCSFPAQQPHYQHPVCAPELYLPFDDDLENHSGLNVWIENRGVQLREGSKAYFDGNSKLVIPRFSNAWWGATVYIHLRFKAEGVSTAGVKYGGSAVRLGRQALLANGDCDVDPSLSVCVRDDGVEMVAATVDTQEPANITVPFEFSWETTDYWQDVWYTLDENILGGYVYSNYNSAPVNGTLQTRPRSLMVGSGGDCDNFRGYMDEVTLFLCKPFYSED